LAYYIEGQGFWTNKRMPFGFTGAPATFTYVTAEKLGDLLPKLEIKLLVNDGGMAGDEFNDMMNHTHQFFARVCETSLSLSAKKSEFFMTSIIFAGARVGPGGVQLDNTKLTPVVDWREPPDLLNLSRFLGLTGYFHNLVKGYAKTAQPLTDLIHSAAIPRNTGKAVYLAALQKIKLANVWGPTQKAAFLSLKKALTLEPMLKVPHFDGTPFIITSDGCQDAFSAL